MKTRTAEEMREFDRKAVQTFGIPGIDLMENAGAAVAKAALELGSGFEDPEFLILAGKGSNGGDAFIAARVLLEHGSRIRLFLTESPSLLTGDAAKAFLRLPERIRTDARRTFSADDISPDSVIVDGLLGTGVSGEIRLPLDSWIRTVNDSGQPVLSIDLPSGLHSGDGSGSLCVRADMTVTMAAVKTGMVLGRGPEVCGRIRVAAIGFPKVLLESPAKGGVEVFTGEDLRRIFRKDAFDAHKNSRGTLLVAGGSAAYSGAPFLAADSALHAGAGVVTVMFPASAEIFCSVPKALIVERTPDSGAGVFTGESAPAVGEKLKKVSAAVFGPGVTCDDRALPVLKTLLSSGKPLVIDADGLNLISIHPEILDGPIPPVILTPHPGEMRRLQKAFGLNPEASRSEQALSMALRTKCTVVLKGSRTVAAEPGGNCSINMSGCPALATAGSGDVLAGLCGAFLANGFSPFDAARMAVFIHGRAGERAVPAGDRGLTADHLPEFFTANGVF